MTSIAGVGSSGTELLYMLRQMNAQGQGVSGANQGPPPPPRDGNKPSEVLGEQFDLFAEEAGLDSEAAAEIKDQLLTALDEAVQSADGTDPREAAQEAIRSVLEENGLDGNEFLSQFESAMGPPPGRGGMQGMGSMPMGLAAYGYGQDTSTTSLLSGLSLLDTTA
ncbi:MAG: hypothetical protein JXQ73_18770 [Phycisphaerae bacterium]|nr:hypothetical protein [Phycisphaerae bacterium]